MGHLGFHHAGPHHVDVDTLGGDLPREPRRKAIDRGLEAA